MSITARVKMISLSMIMLLTCCFVQPVYAQTVNDRINFYVDPNFDGESRDTISTFLIKTTPDLSFYVEADWWNKQDQFKKNDILINLDGLSFEYSKKIYPTLTGLYGTEANPGIDRDPKLTIVFTQTKANVTGYTRTQDGYSRLQAPGSNEREMIYLSLAKIGDSQLKVFVAHEFTHVIELNQKTKLRDAIDDVWLSEARADYTSTLLRYDTVYSGSNLERRVNDFLEQPNNALIDWQGNKYDYAVVSLFTRYLVDQYGIEVLTDSLHSNLSGINAINAVLAKKGFLETFDGVFRNWMITMMVNSCVQDIRYCYLDRNLNNFRISPVLLFLPLSGDSSLSVTNSAKNWSGNWQRIIGGKGDLVIDFSGFSNSNFMVPYLLFHKNGSYTVNTLSVNRSGKGKVTIPRFGETYTSLVLMPTIAFTVHDTHNENKGYPYTFTASIVTNTGKPEEVVTSCGAFDTNMGFGMRSDAVKCLQEFLKNQGGGIYPEGLTTRYFGILTKSAVIRFQKQYGIPQTGFVGPLTRAKIKQLLP